MTQVVQESLTSKAVRAKFQTLPCKTCGHPQGIHDEDGCWSYGYGQDPKCRKHCKKFERDNLAYLEREYLKARKAAKKTQSKKGRYSRSNVKGVSYI